MEKTILYLHNVWYNSKDGFDHKFKDVEFNVGKKIPTLNKIVNSNYDILTTGVYFSFYSLPNLDGVWEFIYNTTISLYEQRRNMFLKQEIAIKNSLDCVIIEQNKYNNVD